MRFTTASQVLLAASAANGLAVLDNLANMAPALSPKDLGPIMQAKSLAESIAERAEDAARNGGHTNGPQLPDDDESGTTSTAALGDEDDDTTNSGSSGAGAAQPSGLPSSGGNIGNGTTTSTAATCGADNQRVEWRNMSEQQKQNFLSAVTCLKNHDPNNPKPSSGQISQAARSRYEDLVAVHQTLTHEIHMSGIFLVWHRYYLWTYARMLREECGYTDPLPWWDEVKDAGRFQQSPLFTDRYFGKCAPANPGGVPNCITTGAFAGDTLHIGPGDSDRDHCLSRAVDESQTGQITQQYVDSCMRTEYADMEGCIELGPHAYGHNGVGSVMAEVSASPGDPAFFMHHGFVDRMFQQWQAINPRVRTTTINGCATPGNNCTPLTMDTVLTSRGLRPDVKVRDVMNIGAEPLCYSYDY